MGNCGDSIGRNKREGHGMFFASLPVTGRNPALPEDAMADKPAPKNPPATDKKSAPQAGQNISREQLIELLNEDLAREYQAIIAYVVYSQVLRGAEYMNIAGELEKHAL